MDKKEIINEFLTIAIKDIDCDIIKYLDDCYQKGESFDEEIIKDLIYQKRLLECYF